MDTPCRARCAHCRGNRLAVMWGALLVGWGLFDLVEGIVDHELLGVHHVNEVAAASQRLGWDLAFLLWGAVMALAGWRLLRSGKLEQARLRPAGATPLQRER